jgi:hypothetical protein
VVVDPATGQWLMWYSGVSRDWEVAIGLALSSDGVRWRKHPDNPVLSPAAGGSWDDAWVAVPTVLPLRSGLWMFYSGVSAQDLLDGRVDAVAVGFAWSMDGARWLGRRAIPVFGPAGVGAPGPWAPTVLLDGTSRTLRMWYETSAGIALATASLPAPLRRAAPERHTPDHPSVLEPVRRERGMQ